MNASYKIVATPPSQSPAPQEVTPPRTISKSSVQSTMQAVVQDRYGDADVLQLELIAVPTPEKNQVLIKVDAAGVDRGTWHLMTGLPYLIRIIGFGVTRPKQPVPGFDLSGSVVANGENVTEFDVGDRVFGIGSGTFAEFALADAGKLSHLPDDVNVQHAAAVPVSGVTALQALRDIGKVQAGQRVLIMGASGGVGTYAVQLSRHFGAHVTGVASATKLDLVRSLEAEEVIDYTSANALDGSQHYELIIDIGGRSPVRELRRALTPDGTLVFVGGEGGEKLTGGIFRQLGAMILSLFVSQRLTMFVSDENGEDVKALADLLSSGELVIPLERAYELAEAPIAIADLAAGKVRGKAIIQMPGR